MFFAFFEVRTVAKKLIDFFIFSLHCKHVCDILCVKQEI